MRKTLTETEMPTKKPLAIAAMMLAMGLALAFTNGCKSPAGSEKRMAR